MKYLFSFFILASTSLSHADNQLVNCTEVLADKNLPVCENFLPGSGRIVNVRKGQLWVSKDQSRDADWTWVIRSKADICVRRLANVASADGVCRD